MNEPNNHWAVVVHTAVQAIREAESLLQKLLTETANRIATAVASTEVDPSVGHQAFILIESNRQKWQQVFAVYLLEACAEVEPFDLYASTTSGTLNLNNLFPCTELAIQVRSEVTHQLRTLESTLAQPLSTLNALISGARGYAEVRPTANPMRPENYGVALQKMVYASTTESPGAASDAKVALFLLKEMIAGLAPLLAQSYQIAILMLSDANVQAVSKRASGFGSLSTRSLPSELFSPTETQPAILTREVLQQALKHRQAASPLAAAPTRKLATHGSAPSFSQIIAQLGRVSAATPVLKERAAKLVPALLVLAQNDPSFLQNTDHPARCFIAKVEGLSGQPAAANPLAIAALHQYAQQQATKAPVASPTARFLKYAMKAFEGPIPAAAASSAKAHTDPNTRPSAHADAAAPAAAAAAATPAPAPAKPAHTSAEQATPAPCLSVSQYGEQIRQHIQQLPGFGSAPQRLQKFMCEPWLLVIVKTYYKPFVAQLNHNAPLPSVQTFDPKGYLGILTSLIASVQPEALRHASTEDLLALKTCWSGIEKGLLSMRLAPHKVQAAIDKLQKMHEAAYEKATETRHEAPSDAATIRAEHLHETPPQARPEPLVDAPPPDAPAAEIQHQQARPIQTGDQQHAPPEQSTELVPLEQILDLQKQFWIGPSEQSVQSTLVWMSSDCTIFMFSTQNGSSQTMTRRRLQQLYTARSFRPIL